MMGPHIDRQLLGEAYASHPFFIVGSPRSGTTLLRLIFDSHPGLAVPEESHFVVGLAARRLRLAGRPGLALERMLAHPHLVEHWDVDPAVLRLGAEQLEPRTLGEAERAVFAAYAAAHGKRRWGDKTPGYAAHIGLVSTTFPDAVFIHIIRDGREVAASLVEREWGPRSPVTGGFWWREKVEAGRRTGSQLGACRYTEVMLRHLISDPEAELRRLCDFIGEDFHPAMLCYRDGHEARRVGALPEHSHVMAPIGADMRAWEKGMSDTERRALEAVTGPLLRQLGFDCHTVPARFLLLAHLFRFRDRMRQLPTEIRYRLHPSSRLV
ncbi:MAG TPA: sulfotransferase [Acidimicrobiales bacterium]|nr:sulfotransferase [Acidimicrobiales bacterium]